MLIAGGNECITICNAIFYVHLWALGEKLNRGNNIFLLILSFRRVLYVVCFLLGNSPASEF